MLNQDSFYRSLTEVIWGGGGGVKGWRLFWGGEEGESLLHEWNKVICCLGTCVHKTVHSFLHRFVHTYAAIMHTRAMLCCKTECGHCVWCLSWNVQDELADVKNFNFDHPNAFDTPALLECLEGLVEGRPVDVPTYDFSLHKRGTETKRVRGRGPKHYKQQGCLGQLRDASWLKGVACV
jgi:hypothetical protein